MSLCWYCYWGWAKPVAEIYLKALNNLNGDESPLLYGAAHLVWSDENFDSAEYCLENFEENKGDYNARELAIVKQSLEELAKLPIYLRCVEPADYDMKHPELYPPAKDVAMIDI